MLKIIEKVKGKNIFSKISILFVSKIYSLFLSLISSMVIVRYLTPEMNGTYNYAIAYTTILSGIALMGLDNVLIKEFSKKQQNTSKLFVASFLVRVIGTLVSFILLEVSILILNVDYEQQRYIWIAALPFLINIFSAVTSWFYSVSQIKYVVISQSMGHTICLMLRIGCCLAKYGVMSFLIVQLLETVFFITLEWIFYAKQKNHVGCSFSMQTCHYLVRQGLPICLGSIAHTLFLKIDQVMIGDMIGDYELGIYSVAVKIAELWYFIPGTIVLVLLPDLTYLYEKKEFQKFDDLLQKGMSWLVLLGYVASLLTMLFSRVIIYILYGEEYYAAAPILCIYIWAGIFINMSVLRGDYFVIMEWTECSMWVNLIGAIVNILMNIVLINLIGSMGAAIATLVSYCAYAYLSSFIIPKLRKIGIIQTKALFLKKLR